MRRSLRHVALAVGLCVVTACASAPEPEARDTFAERATPLDPSLFTLPPPASAERAALLSPWTHLDPEGLVPRALLEDAVEFFEQNKAHIPKQKFLVVVDFTPHSGKDRFFLIELATGAVEPHKVAHGDGTDPDNDGYADVFGNVDGSHRTSLGYYLTGEIYDGTHVHSMRLDGLSPDGSPNGMANTNARSRLIVVHEASYVDDGSSKQQGRSNGCLALDPSIEVAMVDRIHDGTLIYAARSASPLHAALGPDSTGGAAGGGGAAGAPANGGAGGAMQVNGGAAGAPANGGAAGAPVNGGAGGQSGYASVHLDDGTAEGSCAVAGPPSGQGWLVAVGLAWALVRRRRAA